MLYSVPCPLTASGILTISSGKFDFPQEFIQLLTLLLGAEDLFEETKKPTPTMEMDRLEFSEYPKSESCVGLYLPESRTAMIDLNGIAELTAYVYVTDRNVINYNYSSAMLIGVLRNILHEKRHAQTHKFYITPYGNESIGDLKLKEEAHVKWYVNQQLPLFIKKFEFGLTNLAFLKSLVDRHLNLSPTGRSVVQKQINWFENHIIGITFLKENVKSIREVYRSNTDYHSAWGKGITLADGVEEIKQRVALKQEETARAVYAQIQSPPVQVPDPPINVAPVEAPVIVNVPNPPPIAATISEADAFDAEMRDYEYTQMMAEGMYAYDDTPAIPAEIVIPDPPKVVVPDPPSAVVVPDPPKVVVPDPPTTIVVPDPPANVPLPPGTVDGDPMLEAEVNLYLNMFYHLLTKCQLEDNGYFKAADAILEEVYVGHILGIDKLVVKYETLDALGRFTRVKFNGTHIKGIPTKIQKMPSYAVYINRHGKVVKRLLIPQNPTKTKKKTPGLSPSAAAASKGEKIAWVIDGDKDDATIEHNRALGIKDSKFVAKIVNSKLIWTN